MEEDLLPWILKHTNNNKQVPKKYSKNLQKWEIEKYKCLRKAYLSKFEQNEILTEKLLKTNKTKLVDTNDSQNINGILLMQIRWHLQKKKIY